MRVHDLVAHNPVFLVAEIGDEERVVGTAFVVGVRSMERSEVIHGYLVTARHCVVQAQQFGRLGVRVNRRANPGAVTTDPRAWEVSGSETFGPLDSWLYHEDVSNDVAVHPFMPPSSDYMFITVEPENCATDAVIERERMGIGDDLIVAGLFPPHTGHTVNRPIVRAGSIAAMPDEPLRDDLSGLSYSAYLAEVRSVGGLSGSPVWFVISPSRVMPGSTVPERRLHFYLLGLVRGHWTKSEEWIADFAREEEETFNTGIAIVTPIQAALDIIDSPEEVARRARSETNS